MNLSFQRIVRELPVPFGHSPRGFWKHVAMTFVFAGGLLAQSTPPALALNVSIASAPPGGTTQIRIFSNTPQLLTDGGFSITLDPTVFGAVTNAAVFSAS